MLYKYTPCFIAGLHESSRNDECVDVPGECVESPTMEPTHISHPSPALVILQLLLMITIAVLIWIPWSFISPVINSWVSDGQISWIAFLNACLSILYAALAWGLSRQHGQALKHGLLAFTWETRALRQTPAYMVGIANLAILLVWAVWPKGVYRIDGTSTISPVRVAQLCVTVEVVVCSVPLINYARRLCKLHAELHRESHKAKRGQAPGRGGTRMLTSAMDAEYGEYFKIDAYASDVVEKQADYIEVLQTHKQRLAAEINMLANELKYLRCPDGTSSASVNSTGRMAQQGAGEPELRMVQVRAWCHHGPQDKSDDV